MSTILFIQGLQGENKLMSSAQYFFMQEGFAFKGFHLFKRKTNINTKMSLVVKRILSKLKEIEKKDKQIIVIGHSLGSVASVLSVEINKVSKLVLWDPSLNPRDVLVNTAKIYNVEINKDVMNDAKQYIDLKFFFEKISIPTLIVGAGKGGYKIADTYSNFFSKQYAPIIKKIDDADHNFTQENFKNTLLKETLAFIRKSTTAPERRWWKFGLTSQEM